MDPPSPGTEERSPRLYHLELYDSAEDLEMFSEPFRRRDLVVHEKRMVQRAERPAAVSGVDSKDQVPGKEETSRGKGDEARKGMASSGGEEEEPPREADAYCITCCVPIRAPEKGSPLHEEHEVIPLSSVVDIAREALQENIHALEKQIAHLESFSSHLEEIFITVEENFARQEQNFERRYDDVVQTLEQRFEEKMQALGEEKKAKLEALYEQLVGCGESLDTCKELMETIEDLDQKEDKVDAVQTAVATIHRLEMFLKRDVDVSISTPPDFEARVIDFSEIQRLMDSIKSIPAPLPPCAPVINPQDANSATGTSVRVCWSFFSEDLVESYQLYYKRISNDASKEEQTEFMLRVKETYCRVTGLAPNTQYEFWVKALNRAGVSEASESAVYVTAPLPPAIKGHETQSCEHAALVRWECRNTNPVDSYTVELSKQTDGGEDSFVAESIVGIPNCETLIQLEPRQDYLIAVRALNMGGPSERSEPISILSTGTSFTLKTETAHPWLSVLKDGLTAVCCKTETPRQDLPFRENGFTRSVAVLGHPIPFQGKHYWEVDMDENLEYCVGVAFENVPRDSYLGASHSSWCMRHVATPSRHTFEFLNNATTPDIKITVPPKTVGLLLDYNRGALSFFNADIGQHLHTFRSVFRDFVCPCFALEEPGTLRIRNGLQIPTFANLL